MLSSVNLCSFACSSEACVQSCLGRCAEPIDHAKTSRRLVNRPAGRSVMVYILKRQCDVHVRVGCQASCSANRTEAKAARHVTRACYNIDKL